jgi:Ras-related protein Rab-5C
MAQTSTGSAPRKYKVVLLGESGVGKSSLVVRLVKNEYLPSQHSTVGASFFRYAANLEDGGTVNFDIWDTAGQERYKSLASMYYRGAAAALVVYDITAPESFERARFWIKELMNNSPDTLIALVGNKCDREEDRAVPREDAKRLAGDLNLVHIEASAKDGTRVTVVFHEVAKKLAATRAAPAVSGGGVVNAQGQRQSQQDKGKEKKKCDC